MPAKAATPPTFSGQELAKLLALIKGADSVELKLTIPEQHQRSAVAALGMDPLDAEIRQVVFFDTSELALDKQGLVVRARRIQGRGDDSVVKLRPVVPGELPARIRKSTGFRVEVDALPGGYVCSATLKRPLDRDAVRAALGGDRPVRKLFSKEQRAFFADHVEGGIELGDLVALGPILVLKLRFTPKDLGRRLVAELWTYPDGSRVLELSTRCGTADAFQVAAEMRAFLASRSVEISGEQETKTRKALTYFARTMADAAG
ncbi:MAG TPA: hypothetical protein VFW18_03825 [Gaiellales bacterium]|nr:hypothetical protein [Gaiellales bacterium]